MKYQGTKNDPANAEAIDYLLNGKYYYSASGFVFNNKVDNINDNSYSLRCVRDVY